MGSKRLEYNGIFSQRLAILLEERDLRPIDFAEVLKFHKSTVSRWLNGRMAPIPTMRIIADFFGEDVDWLMGRKPDRRKKHAGASPPPPIDWREGMRQALCASTTWPPQKIETMIRMAEILAESGEDKKPRS